jgi:hypothetical protein
MYVCVREREREREISPKNKQEKNNAQEFNLIYNGLIDASTILINASGDIYVKKMRQTTVGVSDDKNNNTAGRYDRIIVMY